MLLISKGRPDLVPTIARYFGRYRNLPLSVSSELITRIKAGHVYDHVTARWLDVIQDRLRPSEENRANTAVRGLWNPRHLGADLTANIGKRLLRAGIHTSSDAPRFAGDQGLVDTRGTHFYPHNSAVRDDSFGSLGEYWAADKTSDVSLAAARQAAVLPVSVTGTLLTINRSGGKALRQLGVLRRVPGRTCGVAWSLEKITGRAFSINWKRAFGSAYRQGEVQAVQMKAAATTNATTFVSTADVFRRSPA